MSSLEKNFIFFVSFLVFLLILFVSYIISYKLGIKKALYRTTYIILSVIFAFVLAPVLNDGLFNLNLTEFNVTLNYEGESFKTLADYIEEVIVHNDFLNDIYKYFPSLKDLFMDFPEVVLAPITYVLLFIIFIILWMPLYLYLSYKRKRRILYDRKENKDYRVWAGIIGAVQCIFLISIILTPINGFNRIYHSAIEETLDDEYHSLCEEIESLSKYSKYCDLIDMYDSTIFAKLGGRDSLNNYVFDSLTRISYSDGYTNIGKEATLIMKSSIILDQSGIFEEVANSENGVIPLSWLMNNNLNDEDVNLIIDTLRKSKYSENLLIELSDLIVNTLDNLINEFLEYDTIVIDYTMDEDMVVEEIKTGLKAIGILSRTNLLNEILKTKDIVVDFIENYPEYLLDDIVVFNFIVRLVNSLNLENFEYFVDCLFESSIFNKTIPHVIDKFFGDFGFKFVSTNGDVLEQFYNFLDFGKLVKKYQPNDFFEFMMLISDEDLLCFCELFQYVLMSRETNDFIDFIFGVAFAEINGVFFEDIYKISNWAEEVFVVRDFCAILYEYRVRDVIDISGLLSFLSNQESEVAQIILRIIQSNVKLFIEVFIAGEELL